MDKEIKLKVYSYPEKPPPHGKWIYVGKKEFHYTTRDGEDKHLFKFIKVRANYPYKSNPERFKKDVFDLEEKQNHEFRPGIHLVEVYNKKWKEPWFWIYADRVEDNLLSFLFEHEQSDE